MYYVRAFYRAADNRLRITLFDLVMTRRVSRKEEHWEDIPLTHVEFYENFKQRTKHKQKQLSFIRKAIEINVYCNQMSGLYQGGARALQLPPIPSNEFTSRQIRHVALTWYIFSAFSGPRDNEQKDRKFVEGLKREPTASVDDFTAFIDSLRNCVANLRRKCTRFHVSTMQSERDELIQTTRRLFCLAQQSRHIYNGVTCGGMRKKARAYKIPCMDLVRGGCFHTRILTFVSKTVFICLMKSECISRKEIQNSMLVEFQALHFNSLWKSDRQIVKYTKSAIKKARKNFYKYFV